MESTLNTFIKRYNWNLNQAQFDALGSFTYNCGVMWMYNSTGIRNAISNNVTGVDFVQELSKWCNAGGKVLPGLVTRRLCEGKLYTDGVIHNLRDDLISLLKPGQKYVEKAGHEVVGEAGDGQEAVEVYEEVRADAVIMDITMPRMSGLEALQALKKIEPNVKVIMCSAMGQQESIATAIQYGAADFVIKPFTEEQIVAKIKQILG